MTSYVNPTTRSGGVEHIVVAERAPSIQVDEAPFDDTQYVRVNGEWQQATEAGLVPDTLAPSPPTALVASGTMAADGGSVDYGLSWNAPTTNTDATALTDLAYYVVRWRYGTTGAWATLVSNETSAILHAAKPATDVQWQVLARDYSGNDSTWAAATITGLADTDGPVKPSVPALSTRLGTVSALWDGLDHAGNPPAADFSHLEFYISATTGGPWAYMGRVSGAGSLFSAGIPIGETRFVTSIAFDTSGNASPRSNEASIVVQGITAPDLEANSVTANAIAVGAVAASKISTGELAAGVRIIAGPEASTHAEMTSTGFKAYIEDPVDLVPNESVRIGTDTNDLFALSDAAGNIKASISDEGVASFSGANVDADPTICGYPLLGSYGATIFDLTDTPSSYGRDYEVYPLGLLEMYAKGTVAWYGGNSTDFDDPIATGQQRGLFELGFDLEPGRQYSFSVSPILFRFTTTGGLAALICHYTTDGTQPTFASPILTRHYSYGVNSSYGSVSISERLINGNTTGQAQIRILVSIMCIASTGNVWPDEYITASIKDLGPVKANTGILRNTYITGGAAPSVPTVRTYTKTYSSTAAYTYQGDGDRRTDTSDVVQGYNSYNGDGKGLWLFPSTIATDLTGATVNKVEVYAYANSWYYNSGGTALIKVHGYTSMPASSPSMTAAKTQASWPKPGGKWVLLPSSLYAGFKSGAYRGFGMGPAGGTNLLYYGRFSGGTSARIRVTYTK